jgi:ankyrin repeat protein
LLLGASIDYQDESGKTPLHVSVEKGNLEVIKCLVEHQDTVRRETEMQHYVNTERIVKRRHFLNIPDIDGNTPLHLGVAVGNNETVSYLVSAGSDLNTCNIQGNYPLPLVALHGKIENVELLLKSKV